MPAIFSALIFAAMLIAFPVSAHANTFGGVMNQIVQDMAGPTSALLSAGAYIAGIVFGMIGVLRLKAHVDNPQQTPIKVPVLFLIAAGAMLALPTVASAVIGTLFGNGGDGRIIGIGQLQAAGGDGFQSRFTNFINDAAEPMRRLIGFIAYIAGLVMAFGGIVRLTRANQDGPRGPGGAGTLTTFLVAGMLMSMGSMMSAISASMFGGNVDMNPLSYNFGNNAEVSDNLNATFRAALAYMQIIGWIGFMRGFFILRAHADGSPQASVFAAITHIVGGVSAVYLGPVIEVMKRSWEG